MEESPQSETVAILPDMSEPLATEAEDGQRRQLQQQQPTAATATVQARPAGQRSELLPNAHPVAVTTNVASAIPSSVGVPVSLPVGSIIGVANSSNGTTFNVITSEQLQVSPCPRRHQSRARSRKLCSTKLV